MLLHSAVITLQACCRSCPIRPQTMLPDAAYQQQGSSGKTVAPSGRSRYTANWCRELYFPQAAILSKCRDRFFLTLAYREQDRKGGAMSYYRRGTDGSEMVFCDLSAESKSETQAGSVGMYLFEKLKDVIRK